jgi:hypothetical protein
MKMKSFEGTITQLSLSPHGDPEGVVLDSGAFVKVPPHSLLAKEAFRLGLRISEEGEEISSELNPVFHHAKLKAEGKTLSDDSLDKKAKEDLKEKHHEENKRREKAPGKPVSYMGRLVAVDTKPKGEVDRLIFEDGTSVHIPKEIELWASDLKLGEEIKVKGEGRRYGDSLMIRAEKISA